MGFLLLKWLHIVAVISWMAGILYLYRLFVYHAENIGKKDIHDLLKVMEKRLMKFITRPAMIITWMAGLGMVYLVPSIAQGGWFVTKFLLVIGLTFVSEKAGTYIKKFAVYGLEVGGAEKIPTAKMFRILNEVPTVLMLLIVGLVVFKPFL